MRHPAQQHKFRVNQTTIEHHKAGGIVAYPGQSVTPMFISSIPPTNYSGGNTNLRMLPAIMHHLAHNIDSKLAQRAAKTITHFVPKALERVSEIATSVNNPNSILHHKKGITYADDVQHGEGESNERAKKAYEKYLKRQRKQKRGGGILSD
jgi:hypothetical protein